MSALPSIHFKIDSVATHNVRKIGSTYLPQQTTSNYNPAVRVIVPNGAYMISSANTHLPIPSPPPSVTKYHGFNHLASGSIFSVVQAFDHNCTAVFDKKSIKIFKSAEVNITALCPPIIQGHRNAPSQPLYSVSLPTHPPSIHKSNATVSFSSIRNRITFYHGVLFSPSISTWRKAIKNGFLQSWPELLLGCCAWMWPLNVDSEIGVYTV